MSLLSFLPPATKLGQGNIFTPVCHSVHRGGMRGCSQGGMRGCSQGGWGACVIAPGEGGQHAWLLGGACVVAGGAAWLLWGGLRGCFRGCVVAPGGGVCVVASRGMHGCSLGGVRGCSWGVCVVARGHVWLLQGGMHGCSGGHAWDTTRYGDMVNERAVRILLECILVFFKFCVKMSTKIKSRNGSSVVCTFLQRSGCSTMR